MTERIFLIDKPQGITSAQVVSEVKRKFRVKVGHAGTLDPMATGLLVCLTGRATRLASFAQGGKKRYTGTILLGRETSTDDVTGEILNQQTPNYSPLELEKALARFQGEIQQFPPRVSAVKVNGKRAYKRARAGEDFALRSRQIRIESFRIEQESLEKLRFEVSCSSGTYIRSLARDLGKELGCGGTLSSLRREESSPFSVMEAVELSELSPDHSLPWYALFSDSPYAEIEKDEVGLLSEGSERILGAVFSRSRDVFRKAEQQGCAVVYGLENMPRGIILQDEKGRWKVRPMSEGAPVGEEFQVRFGS